MDELIRRASGRGRGQSAPAAPAARAPRPSSIEDLEERSQFLDEELGRIELRAAAEKAGHRDPGSAWKFVPPGTLAGLDAEGAAVVIADLRAEAPALFGPKPGPVHGRVDQGARPLAPTTPPDPSTQFNVLVRDIAQRFHE
jgi:hypothetical protein